MIKNPSTNNEIDFVVVIKKLWKSRFYILACIVVCASIGLFVALNTPKQYKVVTTMLPQGEESSNIGGLSSLAAIAGFDIDLNDKGSEISPVIFPQIIESEPFLLKLMHSKYTFSKMNAPISLYDYITKYEKPGIFEKIQMYTIGLPNLIKESIKNKKTSTSKPANDGLTRMNEDEYNIAIMLKNSISLLINKKEGYLTLTTTFSEDLLTAQIAKRSVELLQQTITSYKTKRALEQLEFFEKRYLEKKVDYLAASKRLANYKDENLFMATATGNSTETRLTNEYNLAFSVYSELAKQLENAKIKVKKVTPVFVTIKPITVPMKPYAPRKSIIVAVSVIFGCLLGCLLTFIRFYIQSFLVLNKNKITNAVK